MLISTLTYDKTFANLTPVQQIRIADKLERLIAEANQTNRRHAARQKANRRAKEMIKTKI